MKTWKELRGEILRLGAQDEARYEEEPTRFAEAVNRAMAIVTAAFGEDMPPLLTVASAEDTAVALSDEAAVAVPLLAAFYVYEDEDERKAVRWREDAYDLMRQFAAHKRGFAEVKEGESV